MDRPYSKIQLNLHLTATLGVTPSSHLMEVGQLHQKSPEPLAETSLYNIKKQTPSEASNKFCTRDSSNTEQNYKSIVSSKCCGDVLPTLHEQYFSKHRNHTKEVMSVTEMLHCRSKISCHHLPLTVFSFSIFLACAASVSYTHLTLPTIYSV